MFLYNFEWFNIKAALAYCPVIQKEIELLAKGIVNQLLVVIAFILMSLQNILDSLQPIHNLKQFNHYMLIPTFKMPTIRQGQELVGW